MKSAQAQTALPQRRSAAQAVAASTASVSGAALANSPRSAAQRLRIAASFGAAPVQAIRPKKHTESPDDYNAGKQAFETSARNGRRYLGVLTQALEGQADDVNATEAFGKRYVTNVTENQDTPANVKDFSGKGNYYDTKMKGKEDSAYANYMDSESGRIVASYNYNKYDPKGELVEGVDQINNSEILWQQYLADAAKNNVDVKGLNEVVRSSIQGAAALLTLSMCNVKINERMAEKTWLPDSEEFFAILGTDNCKGIPFLLKDHAQALGRKTIARIIVGPGGNYIRLQFESVG